MNLIMPAEFEQKMKEIASNGKPLEERREAGQDWLCEVLKSLGYEAGVEVFNRMQFYIGE